MWRVQKYDYDHLANEDETIADCGYWLGVCFMSGHHLASIKAQDISFWLKSTGNKMRVLETTCQTLLLVQECKWRPCHLGSYTLADSVLNKSTTKRWQPVIGLSMQEEASKTRIAMNIRIKALISSQHICLPKADTARTALIMQNLIIASWFTLGWGTVEII